MKKYKKNKSIKDICNKFSVFSIILSLIFSFVSSLIVFVEYSKKQIKIEKQRLDNISPLILRPILAEILVGDNRSIKAVLNELKSEFNLSSLIISKKKSECRATCFKQWIFRHYSCLSLEIPNQDPQKYINITLDSSNEITPIFIVIFYGSFPLILLGLINYFLLRRKMNKYIVHPIKNLSNNPASLDLDSERVALEIINLNNKFNAFLEDIEKKRNIIEENKIKESTFTLATKVAHDIRSPVMTLNNIINMIEISNDKRKIIQNSCDRIYSIANDLLYNYKNYQSPNKFIEISFLLPTIEEIIIEKKMEFNKIKTLIILKNRGLDFFDSLEININVIKNIISNILNNSIESFCENTSNGKIFLTLFKRKKYIEIKIIDNGKGIPKAVLSKFKKNFSSYNKVNGNGIGLRYCNELIQNNGGNLLIRSSEKRGTILKISVPRKHNPIWLSTNINLNKDGKVIILGYDKYLAGILHSKCKSFLSMEILEINSLDEIFLKFNNNKNIYLFITGFHEELFGKLNNVKFLAAVWTPPEITEKTVQMSIKYKIKILPSKLINYINKKYFVDSYHILLDDSQIVIDTWKLIALSRKINFRGFTDVVEFLDFINKIPKENLILYIDSNLGDGVKGEDLSQELYKKGFENIYITTGLDEDSFPKNPFIKGVIGKEPYFY